MWFNFDFSILNKNKSKPRKTYNYFCYNGRNMAVHNSLEKPGPNKALIKFQGSLFDPTHIHLYTAPSLSNPLNTPRLRNRNKSRRLKKLSLLVLLLIRLHTSKYI